MSVLERLKTALESGFDAAVRVEKSEAREAVVCLARELGFNVLVDYTAADLSKWPQEHQGRFELTWRLMKVNMETGLVDGRVAVKTAVSDGEDGPPSIKDVFPNGDWLEREVFDMFGVKPADHAAIRRLLLYEEFQGHPLRKDYPIAKRQPLIAPLAPAKERISPSDLRPKLVD
ncbi:MAG: NADH-quinone oxidoreductase subunit C [Elusimicrobia bacterium]|nr:NADH-quinone oxidoreductase subunit C [Elusimicrobiota bacterium]